ncbi:hypothetical protein K0T92_18360 [Paenibacillus oenotherae]|uniref:Phage abortive infection protein n=1 Tax=Paenibacillus oenotherae TaxID=1435645 RepID=A0ABS7D9Z8_9BACL|nr:hypothetical protein [Paenibacillus oenotherae]MBW7476685.1 hypothetical protein [Paenibacillus oenotherae]
MLDSLWNKISASGFNPAVITSIATLIGAFIGASVAQYVSHKLSLSREREKYNKEVFQKLFSPIIFEVFGYFDVANAFRKGHDIKLHIDEKEILNKIYVHIAENMRYATPILIGEYYNIKRHEYEDDQSGYYSDVRGMQFISLFLQEARSVIKKAKLSKISVIRQINRYMFNYYLWSGLIRHYEDANSASLIMSYHWYHNQNYSYFRYLRLQWIIDNDWIWIKRLIHRLTGKTYNVESVNLFKVIKLMTKPLTDNRKEMLKLVNEFENIEVFRYQQQLYNRVTKEVVITDLLYSYSHDTCTVGLVFQNVSDQIIKVSRSDFVLRENADTVYQCKEMNIFENSANADERIIDYEKRSITLEFEIGEQKDISHFSLVYISGTKSYHVFNFLFGNDNI